MFKWLRAIKRAYDVERLEAAEKWLQKATRERERLKKKQARRAAKYEALRKKYAVPEAGRQVVVGGLVEKSNR